MDSPTTSGKTERPLPRLKKRKTRNHVLYKICGDFLEYDSVLNYMFKVAEYFGHEF